MRSPTTTVLRPSRVVALAVIGLVIVVLAILRFTGQPEPVSVPAGARAGDLVMEPCTYPTEDGEYDAECGTLVVRENPTDPQSPLIALPVVRLPAQSPDPGEPVFWLQGGPGQSNQEVEIANRFVDNHDFVMVGYRGIDGSVRLDCPEVESALKESGDVLSSSSQTAYGEAYRACAERFTDEGIDVTRYGLVQQVDDMEAARVALGYDRINLFSESAGTRTAMIYAWRFPDSLHRSVMVAVNPPGNYLWYPDKTDELIDRYAELCAKDEACGARTDDLAASLQETPTPDRWLFLPIKDANVRIISMFGMMETTSDAGAASGPALIDSWLSASEGDPSGLWFGSVFGDLLFPDLFVRGQYAAAASADSEAAREYFSTFGAEQTSSFAYAATSFGWGGGRIVDIWPEAAEVSTYNTVRDSDVETLLINGELDFATPPRNVTELLPYLPNGHAVVLPGFGHVASVYAEQPEAGTHLVTTFYDTGSVDDSLYRPHSIDFTPPTRHTSTAKTVLGLMLALSTLSVISLIGMAYRVHRKGRFGSVTSALLRAPYAVVLGLGGWCLGALVVLTTLPAVNLGNELLAVLAVGVPVALGAYLAWVHRDWNARTRRVGLSVALIAGLLGAWLGFNAMSGPLALVTTSIAATAAANLALIVSDIATALAARPVPTAEARL